MPVRLRITMIFVLLSTVILGLVCVGIYYFSYTARLNTIRVRLTNRAITTARFLGQRETFDRRLIQRIDSLTTIALRNKIVEVYDYQNNKIYSYSDLPGDTLTIDEEILDDSRVNGSKFFFSGDKEVVAYHYSDNNIRMVAISAAEDTDGKESLRILRNILLISFLAGIAFISITGYIFSARLLHPIRKIAIDVEEISAQNLTRRIKTGKTKDEWYYLTNTFNRLLNRLQESFDLQRRFISNASHELSTPLTSISSQLEVSLQREREAGDYRNVMQSIYQDVKNMIALTQTLLEFAKASGNPGGLEINLVRVDEIVLRLPADVIKINAKYSVHVMFGELPESEENLLVFGNEILLFTALKNIVTNACKYSEDNYASMLLTVINSEIRIIISDKGKGIIESEVKNIFQPFYRVEENVSTEGFGLGLSLADRIVRLHKGSIEVQSEIGKGTEFIVRLPAAASLH